jgi:AcrR family transcriptional regulator
MDAHDRLVTATQDLLWERGYVATSPRAIQQRAQAGQGSMYHHFSGKAELAAAAVRRSAEEMKAEVAPIFDGPGGAIERIGAYLLRERDVLKGCRIGRLTQDPEIMAHPKLREPIEEMFQWLRGRIAAIVLEGQTSGELAPTVPPEQIAAAICAVLQGSYVLARAQSSPAPFDEAIEGALGLLASLTTKPTTPRGSK